MRLVSLVFLCAVAACSSGPSDPPGGGSPDAGDGHPTNALASAKIGTNGGSVQVTSGALAHSQLDVPWQAVSAEATFTIAAGTDIADAQFKTVGPAVEFGPSGTQFANAATVTVPYDPAAIPADKTANDLVMLRRTADGTTDWLMPINRDETVRTLMSQTTHFSTFQAAVPLGSLAPVINAFTADRTTIPLGESATLSWNVTNGGSCLIDVLGAAAALPSGTLAVQPSRNTTYTLMCSGFGQASAQVTITVQGSAPVSPAVRHVGDVAPEKATVVASTSAGVTYVAGPYKAGMTFGGAPVPAGRFYVAQLDATGTTKWIDSFDQPKFELKGLATLADGSVVFLGASIGDFVPMTFGAFTISDWGFFLVKIATDGSIADARHVAQINLLMFQDTGAQVGNFLAAAPDGSLYFAGNLAYGPTWNGHTFSISGTQDLLVIKLKPDWSVDWWRQAGGHCETFAGGLDAGASGVAVTGAFTYDATFGATKLTTSEQRAAFVAKWSPAGDLVFARGSGAGENPNPRCGVSSTHQGNSVRMRADGSVLVGGYAGGDFHLSDTVTLPRVTTGVAGYGSGFLVSYAADGTPQWGWRTKHPDNIQGNVIPADMAVLDDGSIAVAAMCEGSVTIGGEDLWNGDDGCVVSLTSTGHERWARRFGAIQGHSRAAGLARTGASSALLVGEWGGTAMTWGTKVTDSQPVVLNGAGLFSMSLDF